MPESVMTTLISAGVAAVVALLGTMVSTWIALRGLEEQAKVKQDELEAQAKLKKDELEVQAMLKKDELEVQAMLKKDELEAQAMLKKDELEAAAARLWVEQETMRQTQLTEIVKKRIETYPALYEIISVYGHNWEIVGKAREYAWVTSFLMALIENDAKHGAFFSQIVYDWHGKLRVFLEDLRRELTPGRMAANDEMQKLYDIIQGPVLPSGDVRGPGLSTYIRDELGSSITPSEGAAKGIS